MRRLFWTLCNIYGYVFGWRFLAPVHKAIAHLSLHALGYGNMLRDTWTGEEWFVKHVLAPTRPKVCLDVGANVGAYTRLLLRHTEAHVWAADPLSGSQAALGTLGDRVTVVPAAVSDTDGEAPIFHQSDTDGMASLDERVRSGGKTMTRVATIQTIAKEQGIDHVDFLKIDTEGLEREVLRGLGRIRPAYIQFEFNIHHLYRDCTFHEIAGLLEGYEFYRLLPHGWTRIDPRKYVDNVFIFCNIVAVDTHVA